MSGCIGVTLYGGWPSATDSNWMENIMTRFATIVGAAALAVAFGAGSAMAQAPTAATTAPAAKTAPKGKFQLKQPMTPIAKQCSAEADAKGLHGKERQKFRNTCKKAGAKKA